ncbi:FMN-dependent oxidoreductase, nitrilotriacetate monooxygenase family [Sphingomonas sp. YR710]|uniref:LLM class flavin-dependent oxidoreductase n=1 Tax=Sphingomonas sp. YR710 TaxID=1882773 RepID=UPI00088BE680|nr:LLM class flavin-dependent oxidoreductase [Sphingomonas sp. YR710]SDC82563.1 FMN-dependent oxidoreductase, nitrilotriacetate monooxygenase family [Sphingomonas sp. YR710]
MPSPQQMHLMLFPMFTGAHVAGWRHEGADPGRMHDIDFHREIVQMAEQAKFDAVFYSDAQGFRTIVGRDVHSRNDVARMDPLILLSALAMVSRRIGLIATLSTSYNEPYSAARRLASLDHVSHGRAGWNVVTSTTKNEARNFGREAHFGHAERYARAEEFVDVAKGLWDSWDDDAFVVDKAEGRFFDPGKLHGLDHKGKFFSVVGPLTTARSPQGHPVIVQAGASEAGQALAARTADVVFTSNPNLESAQAFYKAFKAKVVAAGRAPADCKILPSIQPIIAATDDEARAIADNLVSLIHPDVAISMLELALGGEIDLRAFDPNGPLPPIPSTEGSKSTQAKVIAMGDGLSIMQLARRIAAARTSSALVGSPERVADELEAWFRAGAADGFVIAAPYLPGSLKAFCDGVVPILQQRGLFRTDYAGVTLRDHLGLDRPENARTGRPDRHAEPEIWQPD